MEMINRSVSFSQVEPRPDRRLDVPDRLLHRVRHHVVVVFVVGGPSPSPSGGFFGFEGKCDAGGDGGCSKAKQEVGG